MLRSGTSALVFLVLAACTGGSGSVSQSGTGTGAAALDGTWDVTSYGGSEVGPSSVTIANGRLSGKVEGADNKTGCTTKLEFAIEGDALTGSATPGGTCTNDDVLSVSGRRTVRAADSETPWNGTWVLSGGRGEGDEFELVISGLTATTKDWRLSVAGDLASATGKAEDYTFVARRR